MFIGMILPIVDSLTTSGGIHFAAKTHPRNSLAVNGYREIEQPHGALATQIIAHACLISGDARTGCITRLPRREFTAGEARRMELS